MSSEPVDWVQKRVDCRIEILFERLFSQMKRDVEAFRKTSRGGTFTISPSLVEDLDATVVVRDSNALRRSGVQVTLTDDHRLTVQRDGEEQISGPRMSLDTAWLARLEKRSFTSPGVSSAGMLPSSRSNGS